MGLEFYSDRVLFMVTLKNLNYKMRLLEAENEAESEAKNEAESEAEKITLMELEKALCELLKKNPKITQSEI